MKSLLSVLLICAFLIYAPVMLAAETDPVTGTVAEVIESGGYVYLKLEEQGIWIAANSFTVSKGDKVQYSGGMEMNNFHSNSLDRTFESILFVSQAGLVSDDGTAKTAMTMQGHSGEEMPMPKPKVAQAPAAGEITPLPDGKTIAAVFAESGQLQDQVVSLNARVIKISKNIMGKNWITLQDGTGTEPENKLLATSQEVVTPGDLVIVKGIIKTDVDLGSGYTYKVLLEEASFSPGLE